MPVTYTSGLDQYLSVLPQALQSLMSGGSPTRHERKAVEWLAQQKTLHSVLSAEPLLQDKTPGILRALRLCLEKQSLNYFEEKLLNRLVELLATYWSRVNDTVYETSLASAELLAKSK